MANEQMWQVACYPHNLKTIVGAVRYKDWAINLDFYDRETGGEGLTLRIRFPAADSTHAASTAPIIFWIHDFEVPARNLDDESWQEWVFECIMAAERHEAMEQFTVHNRQVFMPAHNATSDMYKTKHVAYRRSIG